jgi:hypothetical protein
MLHAISAFISGALSWCLFRGVVRREPERSLCSTGLDMLDDLFSRPESTTIPLRSVGLEKLAQSSRSNNEAVDVRLDC